MRLTNSASPAIVLVAEDLVWWSSFDDPSRLHMNRTRSATARANPISWVTTTMVMPSRAKAEPSGPAPP